MKLKKQVVPLLLLAFFFAWQTDTVLHLLITPHTICEHGKVVDADPESGRPHHDPQDKNNPNHKGCRVLTLLTSAETRVSDDPPPSAVVGALENKTFILFDEIVTLDGSELFLLSPCNSPPSFS